MNNQEEALSILKGLELTTGNSNILKEPLKLAISALEKQIPKKPLKGGNHLSDDIYNLCPACSRLVGVNFAVDNRTDYCPDCGQAIDWRNEDE